VNSVIICCIAITTLIMLSRGKLFTLGAQTDLYHVVVGAAKVQGHSRPLWLEVPLQPVVDVAAAVAVLLRSTAPKGGHGLVRFEITPFPL
jgi:hypothetical protein